MTGIKNLKFWGWNPLFVDLFGFALEGEADFAGGQYEFDFDNQFLDEGNDMDPIPFVWARASYAVTLKKNIMD